MQLGHSSKVMDSDALPGSSYSEEWSVVLDGRYVVAFQGPHAQEFALRQLHELTRLLRFFDFDKTTAER